MRKVSVLLVVIGVIGVVLSCGQIAEDELVCEEAVSKLQDCCRGFDARRLPCVRSEGGCKTSDTRPALSVRASQCILDKQCSAVVSEGVCDRAITGSLLPYTLKGEGTKFDEEVCR